MTGGDRSLQEMAWVIDGNRWSHLAVVRLTGPGEAEESVDSLRSR